MKAGDYDYLIIARAGLDHALSVYRKRRAAPAKLGISLYLHDRIFKTERLTELDVGGFWYELRDISRVHQISWYQPQ